MSYSDKNLGYRTDNKIKRLYTTLKNESTREKLKSKPSLGEKERWAKKKIKVSTFKVLV